MFVSMWDKNLHFKEQEFFEYFEYLNNEIMFLFLSIPKENLDV